MLHRVVNIDFDIYVAISDFNGRVRKSLALLMSSQAYFTKKYFAPSYARRVRHFISLNKAGQKNLISARRQCNAIAEHVNDIKRSLREFKILSSIPVLHH